MLITNHTIEETYYKSIDPLLLVNNIRRNPFSIVNMNCISFYYYLIIINFFNSFVLNLQFITKEIFRND